MDITKKLTPEIVIECFKTAKNLWKIYLDSDDVVCLFFCGNWQEGAESASDLLHDYHMNYVDAPYIDFTTFSKEEFDTILGKPEHGFIQRAREIYSTEDL